MAELKSPTPQYYYWRNGVKHWTDTLKIEKPRISRWQVPLGLRRN